MRNRTLLLLTIFIVFFILCATAKRRKPEEKRKCPKVKAIKNFDIEKLLGTWYVIQYYASSEEALPYRCMRAEFSMSEMLFDVTMNFTYSFVDDPINEQLVGNITWLIPNVNQPAHWIHSEDTYEGIYNTYVLDSDYTSWSLLLHCAEKSRSPRYLSSFIMSREKSLGNNVISYLRDKLPRYDIDLSYMFEMTQSDCDVPLNGINIPPSLLTNKIITFSRRHPLKSHHDE